MSVISEIMESNAPRQLLSVFLVACAFLSYPAVAHGPLICLRNTQGESLRLIGVLHNEGVGQTSEADILQVRGDAKQVLFELDPEKDTIFDCAKRMIKTGDWSLVGQNLTEETKARLIKFLSLPADILDKLYVNGIIVWVIYVKGMSRAGATLPPPKMENFTALEKTIKSEFVKSKLPVNEIEGCESYSKTMQDFKAVDYDALINQAIDCAENSECIKDFPKTALQAREASFSNYDDFYRIYNLYPSLDTRTLDVRNIIMHKNIVKLSRNTSSTLVVVGMAHIGGPSGLLKLLKGDGFEPIQCNGAAK